MEQINNALFLLLNAGSDLSPWLLFVSTFLAKWLVLCLPLLLVAGWLWGSSHFREVAVKAALAVLLGIIVVQLIRFSWPHPRPFVAGLGVTYLKHAPDPSFPSNHAMFCFSMAFSFFLGARHKTGWFILCVGLLVSWARVFLGVHFPFDMLGAWGIAFLIAILIHRLFHAWHGDRFLALLEGIYRRVLAVPITKGWISS